VKGQQVQSVRLIPQNGTVSWNWNGRDTKNMQTAAGIYLVRISDSARSTSAKTLKLK
jgi:flagellar hook assembly protein FlgD